MWGASAPFRTGLTILLLALCPLQTGIAAGQQRRPNVLLIVADDLGYSDIGACGSEISTPTLDELAGQSTLFSNFHVMPSCAPTRAILLTGCDNHLAGIGAQHGLTTPQQVGQPGYEGYLNSRVAVLPEVLRDVGYRTYHVGKWHLGHQQEQSPFRRGFQETFALLGGGGSHYADQTPLGPDEQMLYRRNGELVRELPDDFYSTKSYTDHLLEWLQRDRESASPFFAYVAYTAPHDPLHAPKAYIRKYQGRYAAGYEVLRRQRFQQLKTLGLISREHSLPRWPRLIRQWDQRSAEYQRNSMRDMETYAAMVDYMDEQIGRICDWLKEARQFDNTLIIFLSDNGANGMRPDVGYRWTTAFGDQFENRLENRGMPGSFTSMEAGWAASSGAAFRYFKHFTTEGGVRAPCLIRLPGKSLEGGNNAAFTHVRDLMPTVLDVLNVEHPGTTNEQLETMQGHSLVDLIAGNTDSVYQGEGIGFELHGTRAYVRDGWKILQLALPLGTGEWELYDLNTDPSETNNLVFSNRAKFTDLLAEYNSWETEMGVVYGLPKIFGVTARVCNAVFWLIVVIFSVSILATVSGRLEQKYVVWGYGTRFMYALGVAKLIGVIGLFTLLNTYAAGFLACILAGALVTLLWNRENWTSFLLPAVTTVLVGTYLFIKLGYLSAMLT